MKQSKSRRRFVTLAALIGAVYVFGFRGPTHLASYPTTDTSPYRLPFERGTSRWCAQGNRSTCSHRGRFQYSYDFLMPVGTPVIAARGGTVVDVNVAARRIGNFPGNRIVIEHPDGTQGFYVHLDHGGATVVIGQTVSQGQVIGNSGTTGRSLFPHIHFHVEKNGDSIPVSFWDVSYHRGVPRTGFMYTAGGVPQRPDANTTLHR